MVDIDYTKLILGYDIPFREKVTIHVPTIKEIIDIGNGMYSLYTMPFTVSIRELFSPYPEIVDSIEEQFPTVWDAMLDEEGSNQVVKAMTGQNDFPLAAMMMQCLAWWTKSDAEDYQFLSNGKIVNEKLDWVIDFDMWNEFSAYIKVITMYQPNEDLTVGKGLLGSKHRQDLWRTLYKNRLKKQQAHSQSMGDKILILQAEMGTILDRQTIENMTYYQLMNYLNAFAHKEGALNQMMIYTSQKFDTQNMKLNDWRENVSLLKN